MTETSQTRESSSPARPRLQPASGGGSGRSRGSSGRRAPPRVSSGRSTTRPSRVAMANAPEVNPTLSASSCLACDPFPSSPGGRSYELHALCVSCGGLLHKIIGVWRILVLLPSDRAVVSWVAKVRPARGRRPARPRAPRGSARARPTPRPRKTRRAGKTLHRVYKTLCDTPLGV